MEIGEECKVIDSGRGGVEGGMYIKLSIPTDVNWLCNDAHCSTSQKRLHSNGANEQNQVSMTSHQLDH